MYWREKYIAAPSELPPPSPFSPPRCPSSSLYSSLSSWSVARCEKCLPRVFSSCVISPERLKHGGQGGGLEEYPYLGHTICLTRDLLQVCPHFLLFLFFSSFSFSCSFSNCLNHHPLFFFVFFFSFFSDCLSTTIPFFLFFVLFSFSCSLFSDCLATTVPSTPFTVLASIDYFRNIDSASPHHSLFCLLISRNKQLMSVQWPVCSRFHSWVIL